MRQRLRRWQRLPPALRAALALAALALLAKLLTLRCLRPAVVLLRCYLRVLKGCAAPPATAAVVLAAGGASPAEVSAALDAVLSVRAFATLQPRVLLYAPPREADALRRVPRVDAVLPADAPDEAFLRYVAAAYHEPPPDYVLYAVAPLPSPRALRAALRRFRGREHLLPLAPTAGCGCHSCGNESGVAAAVRELRSAAAAPCVEPATSFARGQFLVSRAGIHRQPLEFYTDTLALLRAARPPGRDAAVFSPRLAALDAVWASRFACFRPDWRACMPPALPAPAAVPAKTVWLLWLSGWGPRDGAPWLVQQVAASWRFHNPGWHVALLTAATLGDYLAVPYLASPAISPQAASDVIRLHLLARHGGVWADATALCLRPLDDWLPAALAPTGFWMYHSAGYPRPPVVTRANSVHPASWFMAAARGAYMARAWAAAADAYWAARNGQPADNYFWMDALFRQLLASDARFAADWARTPFVSADDPGQANMLLERTLLPVTPADVARLAADPPVVLKLSHHRFPRDEAAFTPCTRGSAAYVALQAALLRRPAPAPRANATALDGA